MKVIAVCALMGAQAINLNRLSGNVCINEIGEDTNELLGLDNDYQLVELDTEPPEKIAKDMEAADKAAHDKREAAEHAAEKKAAADKK